MASSARLAKAGHQVALVEAGDRLGGTWSSGSAPTVLSFPAPWRDLFRKSGRSLEEECRRSGLELGPAPPTRHDFADGSVLDLPVGRGEQFEAIQRCCGDRAARAWPELIDSLATVWQQLRFLGLETELADPSRLDRRTRTALWADRSLADLAETLPDQRLRALVADLGYLNGSTPTQTPAHGAVSLFVDSTFGRWQLRPDQTGSAATASAAPLGLSELTALLISRLELRRVRVALNTQVLAIETDRTGVRAVLTRTAEGIESIPAEAVVVCADPWRAYREWLADSRAARRFRVERRAIARTEPAMSPQVDQLLETGPSGRPADFGPSETCQHREDRPPVVEARHQAGSARDLEREPGFVRIRYDYGNARPDREAGVRWQGFASWLDRPPTTSALPGVFLAGPWSRSGQGPDREILSAALASNAVLRSFQTQT